MTRMSESRTSRSLVATVALGAVGIGGVVVALVRKRARRRRDRGEVVFSKASAGLWPPVPHAPEGTPRIDADLAGQMSRDHEPREVTSAASASGEDHELATGEDSGATA